MIIGGGFSGMTAAIELKKLGIDVDLVEIDENWRTDGAGITVSIPTLRALNQVGVIDQFLEKGTVSDGLDVFGPHGKVVAKITPPPAPGIDLKGSGGIMRPDLAKILAEATKAAGVNVLLGTTFEEIIDAEDQVEVVLKNGTRKSYDLVIGADGVYSSVRKHIFTGAPEPKYTGQGVWRAVVPRFDTERPQMHLGPRGKIGFTHVNKDDMYLYYTETREKGDRVPEDQLVPQLKSILSDFSSEIVVKIRDHLSEDSQVLLRPLEGLLLPRPWYKGRVQLIGDAVHATTPHLASGAGMGIEDAVVFAEEVAKGGTLESVLERYQNRRWERCRLVVQHSLRLGEIELAGGKPAEEHAQIMMTTMAALVAPY
jgi:2-polyprenyl-6-methoxyphenol hydroxylase-like FAD-dependent oxidoreductase